MTKEIKFNLEYRDKGQKKTLPLSINFVSQWAIDEYNEFIKIAIKTELTWKQIEKKYEEIAVLNKERAEGYEEKIKEIEVETIELRQSILDTDIESKLKKQFEVLTHILESNGYKDEFLFDYDFWYKCVDPNTIISFLAQCVIKDINQDKKKIN